MPSGVTHKLQIDLRYQIKALSEHFAQLGAKLAQAAQDLREPGIPPSQDLLDALALMREDFVELRAQLLGLARIVEVPGMPEAEKLVSLKDLAEVLQSTLDVKKKSKMEEAKRQVLQKLDRVLLLAHRDRLDFLPLAECQAKARGLQAAIASADWTNPSQDLVDALLPFMDLLAMVEQLDELSDETCERLQDVIVPAFGKLLALAAARGRLVFVTPPAEAPAAPAPVREPTVAPASPVEAGGAPVDEPAALTEMAPSPLAAPLPQAEAGEPDLPELVAELYTLLGHKVQKAVSRPKGVVDLLVRSSNGKKWIARCRSQEEKVTETEVRDFYSVMQQEKVAQGAIITLGIFTPQARQWAKSNLLYLLDQREFFEYLKRARTRPSEMGGGK